MTKDYLGEIVGNYQILERTCQKDNSGHSIYKGKCIHCGTIEFFPLRAKYSLGKICSHYDRFGFPTNYSNPNKNRKLINTFNKIKTRCYDKDCADYKWYGRKGIVVCDEWLNNPNSFVAWSISNGYREDLTIDRIDSSKNYCPENCRWITREENSRRAGNVNWITINGKTLTGRQWSKKINKGINFVNRYIRLYGLEKTVQTIKNKLRGELV